MTRTRPQPHGPSPRRDGSSIAGVVFGIRQTVVKPPCAAAARPVATVSASSLPGSRKCAWRSTNPGATSVPSGVIPAAASPSSQVTRTSVPSLDLELRRSLATGRGVHGPAADGGGGREPDRHAAHAPLSAALRSRQQVEQRHPHGHAVGHLGRDHRSGVHRHVGRDLDALVHRARVHHHHVRLRGAQPLGGQPVPRRVLAQGREQAARHPLLLDPERHHRRPRRAAPRPRPRSP